MESDRLIYIRTDGNSKIASGHLVRCFSIANACRKLGMKVCFLVSDAESASFLKNNLNADYPIICLKNASYDNLEQELTELLPLLARTKRENLVFFLDSYFVTKQYLAAIRPLAKLVYLDDLMLFDYPVDLVINYDVIPEESLPSYQAAYHHADKLLLGASYAPLRDQFQNREVRLRKHVSDLLFTTGGSDPCHFCLAFLHYLQKTFFWNQPCLSDITIHLVIGSMSTDHESLYSLAQSLPALKLYKNLTDMASLMETCDLAISASGTTLYELCALGVPAISYTMADNQLPSAKAFARAGIIPYAGDIRLSMDQVLDNILSFITQMTRDEIAGQPACPDNSYLKRKTAHETMRSFIDGNGSIKIAEAIKQKTIA